MFEVLDIFLYLRVKEINIVEEKGKKMTHKEKMKVSRSERKVFNDFFEKIYVLFYKSHLFNVHLENKRKRTVGK